RYGETENARRVYERMVFVHPQPKSWLAWARFEQDEGEVERARDVYGQAVDRLTDEFMDQHVFISFARFEASLKEYERARAIYKYALEHLPKSKSQALYNQYTLFEKQHGDSAEIEDVVVTKRRMQYEQALKHDSRDYDTWIDYVRLEESTGEIERTRDVYERAIAEYPTVAEKRLWRRYIYLWLFYALFEETQAKDPERAREVYAACVDLVPHKSFTFAKLWLQYAWFEVRQENLDKARRALGRAIGMCPKHRLFRGYIEMELELREFDRVRTLYSKYLEFDSTSCATWVEFARLETALGETERCRALFEIAVQQPVLDMPEVLWKAFIDFEFDQGEYDRTRELYTRLLSMTDHVKVWVSMAHFELTVSDMAASRAVYERGYNRLKSLGLKDERLALLEAWKEAEDANDGDPEMVEKKMPKRVRKRRELQDGTLEEYFDYVFPDDSQGAGFKLLAKAHLWKQKATQEGQ
ncbi:Crooked neck-like protein 1, partial [Linderina macrospora]